MLSYNVAGLKNKLELVDFFNYIYEFDIIVLLETHVLNMEESRFKNIFINYEVQWIPATKTSIFGRGSGGELFAYRKHLEGVIIEFKRIEESYVLKMIANNIVSYIVPTYLNCSHWQRDYDRLSDVLTNLGSSDINLIGDFNGRIGISQNSFATGSTAAVVLSNRSSKDEICDNKGAKIMQLADAFDCRVLNGSCEGDARGEYTFVRGSACSVIDYCFISGNWHTIFCDFRIGIKTFSDHMPLEITFKGPGSINEISAEQLKLLPKLFWCERNLEQYQHNMNTELRHMQNTNTWLNIDNLTEIIKKAIPTKPSRRPANRVKIQKWFDGDCVKARDKSFAYLRLLRLYNVSIFKTLYAAANKEFKNLCLMKKSAFEQQSIAIINNARSSADFWKAVKVLTGKKKCYSHMYECATTR